MRHWTAATFFLSLLTTGNGTAHPSAESQTVFLDYGVFFDPRPYGLRANSGKAWFSGGELMLAFTGPLEDEEAGVFPYVTRSRDLGKTWMKPERFGTDLIGKVVKSTRLESWALCVFGPTRKGTLLAFGSHIEKGLTKENQKEVSPWYPVTAILGRQERGQKSFTYEFHPSGAFLYDQWIDAGLMCRNGRIVLTIWGAPRDGANWQCGVLLSDDDGRTWRYRKVGDEPDPGIRDNPKVPAGFNEQTLFETGDGRLISIIRGREKLGRVPESPRDTWFFRSVSGNGGETWSKPQPTNLAGTGAPSAGLVLPDGSLLSVSRIPFSRTMVKLTDPDLFGLRFVRSFDSGQTWETVKVIQRDPDGNPFDAYHNALNGQFLRLSDKEWVYIFGQFARKTDVHRILKVRLQVQ